MQEYPVPVVSIVVITYGQEQYIEQTLKGILQQKLPSAVEVIISDDCSPDDTFQVYERVLATTPIPDNFTLSYTKHSKNIGAVNNFLWALEKTSGKFVALCEGDDYWSDPNKLSIQVETLKSDNSLKICCTNYHELREELFSIQYHNNVKTAERYTFTDLLYRNMIPTLTAVFVNPGKVFWEQFRNLLESDLFLMGDYPLWLKLLSDGGQIIKIPRFTAVYRILSESASHSTDPRKLIRFEENVLMIRSHALDKSLLRSNSDLRSSILNNSYGVLAMYKHPDATSLMYKIAGELRKRGLSLTKTNKRNKFKMQLRNIKLLLRNLLP